MFSGPPLPLSPDLPLSRLLAHANPPGTLGAWVRGSARELRIVGIGRADSRRVLVSGDVGFLLGRCSRVALREGSEVVVLASELIIHWRALQVVTSAPYLPGLERLKAMFPGLQSNPTGFQVPIQANSPEEVLAECLAHGMQVTGSQIVYSPNARSTGI